MRRTKAEYLQFVALRPLSAPMCQKCNENKCALKQDNRSYQDLCSKCREEIRRKIEKEKRDGMDAIKRQMIGDLTQENWKTHYLQLTEQEKRVFAQILHPRLKGVGTYPIESIERLALEAIELIRLNGADAIRAEEAATTDWLKQPMQPKVSFSQYQTPREP